MKHSSPGDLTDDEQKLKRVIEEFTGGRLVELTPQIRWRPAWFAKVDKDGEILPVYVRGDRPGDIMPFTDILEREANILQVLEKHKIPVPHVYGMCEDPKAIIMADVPGTRDVSKAKSDAQRKRVARQYVEAIAAMHAIPVEEFEAIGLDIPRTPREIALSGIKAYTPLYNRSKVKPDPMLEFSIRWLSENFPPDRTEAGLIQNDAGQFLYDDSGLTALYDFEFAIVGEPLCDLGTMGGRNYTEPMGASIPDLCRHYQEVSGRQVDTWVAHYQQAVFLTCANMQFVGCRQDPKPGDHHDVYREWDMGMRHNMLLALGYCMDIEFVEPEPMPKESDSENAEFRMLADLVAGLEAENEQQQAAINGVSRMVEYMAARDLYRNVLSRKYREEAIALMYGELVGRKPAAGENLEQCLEQFVRSAPPERDKEILQFFYRASKRLIQAVGHTRMGLYAANVKLELVQ